MLGQGEALEIARASDVQGGALGRFDGFGPSGPVGPWARRRRRTARRGHPRRHAGHFHRGRSGPDPFRGGVIASAVLRCTEGYTAELAGNRRDLAPFSSTMIATEPLGTDLWDEIGLSDRELFGDLRHMVIYGQRTADDRIAFGGRGAPHSLG